MEIQTVLEKHFHYNVLTPLIQCDDIRIKLLVKRDLLCQKINHEDLWELKELQTLLKKQQIDGSWKYATKRRDKNNPNLDQYQTFKHLSYLVEHYNVNRNHTAVVKAADYFFAHQSDEGDFRGIYDKQYTPNYTAAIAELLIKAGYVDDHRIEHVFDWLLIMRQQDGGWALPFRTRGYNIDVTYVHSKTIQPDLASPSSHMVTGVVLRAFSAHPYYKHTPEAKLAAQLLTDQLFKNDRYPDRRASQYWTQFVFPFCYTDLISAMDSLSQLNVSVDEPQIIKGLTWFADHQHPSGLWDLKITAGRDKNNLQLWLALAICRIVKQFYSEENDLVMRQYKAK